MRNTEGEPPDGGVSSGGSTGEGATSSGGRAIATGGKTTIAKGGTGPGALCGNGRIDPGEQCDPTVPTTLTCSSATMGAKPAGLLRCTKTCVYDTTNCTSGAGGATGTGGVTGSGGGISKGGQAGSIGLDGCLKTPTILSNDCTQACGCKLCPDAYAACTGDGGCAWILACAHQVGCVSIDDCYQTSCASMIDRAGGRNSIGAKHAGPALACLADNGCGVACP